jgi:hypothetical protein
VIVFLLSAILAVLLFGKEIVLANLQIEFWLVLASAGFAVVWFVVKAFFIDVPAQLYRDIKAEKDAGRSWLARCRCREASRCGSGRGSCAGADGTGLRLTAPVRCCR